MEDSDALVKVIAEHLKDWIERGQLVGDVQTTLLTENFDLQCKQVFIEFKVAVRLELAQE